MSTEGAQRAQILRTESRGCCASFFSCVTACGPKSEKVMKVSGIILLVCILIITATALSINYPSAATFMFVTSGVLALGSLISFILAARQRHKNSQPATNVIVVKSTK